MIRRVLAISVCASLLSGFSVVLAEGEGMPEPTPKHRKLGYFVGEWTGEAQLMENPFMPAGKFSSTSRCDWFEGRFAVVCKGTGEGPMGPTADLGIMGYSMEEQVYTYYGVDNSPMAMLSVARGTVDGDTWVYHDESMMMGQMVKSRYTIVQKGPESYTFEWAMADEDGKYQVMMKGMSTKK
jgi:hypothetical protein